MNTTIATTIDQILRRLPREGVQREVAVQRLTEMYASGEAMAALRAAAERARKVQDPQDPGSEAVADVLGAASELWDGNGVPVHVDGDDHGLRDQLVRGVTSRAFQPVLRGWIVELRRMANKRPSTGACTVATALQLWNWTFLHFRQMPRGAEAAMVELAEAFCWLAAARSQILETVNETSGAAAHDAFLSDLCHVQAARSAGAVATACAELVFGYRQHPAWDAGACKSCYNADDLDELEGLMPGIASSARAHSDVIEVTGAYPSKAGPCAKTDGVEGFLRLRAKLDSCLTGSRLTKQRAAAALPLMLATAGSTSTH